MKSLIDLSSTIVLLLTSIVTAVDYRNDGPLLRYEPFSGGENSIQPRLKINNRKHTVDLIDDYYTLDTDSPEDYVYRAEVLEGPADFGCFFSRTSSKPYRSPFFRRDRPLRRSFKQASRIRCFARKHPDSTVALDVWAQSGIRAVIVSTLHGLDGDSRYTAGEWSMLPVPEEIGPIRNVAFLEDPGVQIECRARLESGEYVYLNRDVPELDDLQTATELGCRYVDRVEE